MFKDYNEKIDMLTFFVMLVCLNNNNKDKEEKTKNVSHINKCICKFRIVIMHDNLIYFYI